MSPRARRALDRTARGRPRRAARVGAWAVRVAVVLLAFVLGVALGRALEDNPRPGGDRTYVRTLKPRQVSPAPPTVTVTVTRR